MLQYIFEILLQVSDRGPPTDMEEEASTMNGSESVLNSSFNSALSGFESLLRKQMGSDESDLQSSQNHIVREGHHQRNNGEVKRQGRSGSPVMKGHYDRIDSGYHGTEYVNTGQCDRNYRTANRDHHKRDEYSSRNGDDRGQYNDMDFEPPPPNRRPPLMKSPDGNSWSMSKDSRTNKEEISQQSSFTSEQELRKYFDRRNSEKSVDRRRRSMERLTEYNSDRIGDTGRTQSAERINQSQSSYQNCGQRNNSADTLDDNYKDHRVKHDLPPRGRSASPYRYNRYRDYAQDDNPYKEMDPKFRNTSQERSTVPRDRSLSPPRENRNYCREYHSLPPNLPSSSSNVPHQRDPHDCTRPLESSTPNNQQTHSQHQ